MVGCRGELPECFEACYEFLKGLPVTQLHVFPYSERPGTAALRIPYVVDDKEKKRRAHQLLVLSDEKTQAFYAEQIGQEADVLFERQHAERPCTASRRTMYAWSCPPHKHERNTTTKSFG